MSEGRTCHACHQPTTGTVILCPHCTRQLAEWLRHIPDIDRELTVTLTRQDCTTHKDAHHTHMAAPALPYHVGASDAQHALRATIHEWAAWLHTDLGAPHRATITGRSHQLAAWMPTIRKHDAAPDLYNEIRETTEAALLVVDLPTLRPSIGQCPQVTLAQRCEGSVTMRDGYLWCDTCGCEWSPDMWDRLAQHIGADQQPDQRIPIAVAALILGVTPHHARQVLKQAGIHGTYSAGALMYPHDKIQQLKTGAA